MKGEFVIVQEFGGRPLIRRVWDATSEAVFVCSEERFNALSSGENTQYPIGFPRENVYEYDASKAVMLGSLWQVDPGIWQSMTPWKGAGINQ